MNKNEDISKDNLHQRENYKQINEDNDSGKRELVDYHGIKIQCDIFGLPSKKYVNDISGVAAYNLRLRKNLIKKIKYDTKNLYTPITAKFEGSSMFPRPISIPFVNQEKDSEILFKKIKLEKRMTEKKNKFILSLKKPCEDQKSIPSFICQQLHEENSQNKKYLINLIDNYVNKKKEQHKYEKNFENKDKEIIALNNYKKILNENMGNKLYSRKFIHECELLEAFIYCLKYCLEYPYKRKDLIVQNEDRFNIHFLSKKSIDTQNPFFIHISNMLNDLIDSKNIKFKEEELFKIKLASGKLFNSINIKIAELSKNYKDCLNLFLEEENNKLKEKVFDWIEDKFKFFNRDYNNKKNNKNKKNYENFFKAIIELIPELVKLNEEKTKKIVSKYFKNDEKLEAYKKLKYMPSEQFEILKIILLYEKFEQIKEEEENQPKENGEEHVKNIDLFQLYKSNININIINLNQEKIIKEQFDNLLLEQITLLVKLNRKKDVIKYLKIDIPYYPTFPLREALNICIENSLFEAAIYIYQVLNENRESFNLTLKILDKSFEKFKQNPEQEEQDFLDKLNLSIQICKENSESLLKKDPKEKTKKESDSEGEDLWFDLLKKIYELEDTADKIENNKKIKESLQKGKATLLKEISSYVRIQKLITYVTEKQEKAEYKEYKTILETMLRWNNSFDRVLYSVMTILKTSIENAESIRKKVTSKGNNYNIKKCDVCNQFFQNTKDEIVYFFGCGHQSHEKCCYKKKINTNKNRIILHKKEENEESFLPECEVCRKNKIENRNRMEDDYEEFIMSEDREDTDIIISKENIKMKAFKFGNKKDKFKKLEKYDIKYQNEVSIFNN